MLQLKVLREVKDFLPQTIVPGLDTELDTIVRERVLRSFVEDEITRCNNYWKRELTEAVITAVIRTFTLTIVFLSLGFVAARVFIK